MIQLMSTAYSLSFANRKEALMLIDLSRVGVSGPLSAFATGFADHMTRQGYSPSQTRIQLLLLNRLSNWLVSEGLVAGELRAKEVE